MNKWMMGISLAVGLGIAQDAAAQGGQGGAPVKIEAAIPMANFGWNAGEGAKDAQGRADLLSELVTNRAMVVETEVKEGRKKKLVNDTLIFVPVPAGDPAEGHLLVGFNESGRDVQAFFPNEKAVFFLNSPRQMTDATALPVRLEKYDARKHGKINTWVFND